MRTWSELLGWMLVHSVWLIALVVGVSAVGLRALRNRSANARHLAGCAALLLSVGTLPGALAWLVWGAGEPAAPFAARGERAHRDAVDTSFDDRRDSPNRSQAGEASGTIDLAREVGRYSSEQAPEAGEASRGRGLAGATGATKWWPRIETRLRPFLSWIVGGWLCGVGVLSLRPALGWRAAWRLRRVGLSRLPPEVSAMASRVAERLRLRRAIAIFESSLVSIPCIVGAFKPMILFPASAISGLSAEQLEAVLAHELAHVRRHDFLVNALQTIAETLLFYHPAIWWLSRHIRHEREHCCDDLAVSLCSPVEYCRALLALEQLRAPQSAWALGATDGSLVSRVRRIAGTDAPASGSHWSAVLLAGASVIAASVLLTSVFAQTDESNPQDDGTPARAQVGSAAEAKSSEEPARGASSGTPSPEGVKEGMAPKGKEARSLFQSWQANSRGDGKVPGGRLAPLVRVMSNFVKHNPTHEGTPKFAELLKRIEVSRDWSPAEAVKLLDEVSAIYPSLPEWVESETRFRLGGDVVRGRPLPKDLNDAPWGEPQANGLRAAWLLEPRAKEYRLNTPLKSRLLFHNSGKDAVVFRALTWNQPGPHQARDAQGVEINVQSTFWTTIPRVFACRLAPGEFLEVVGAGIGVGANKDDEDWRDGRLNVRVGSWIEAKAGDKVTFLPAAVDCAGREAGVPEGEVPIAAKNWWQAFIQDRLSLDAPLPADAEERARLLRRATQDLFGAAPTDAELLALKNDTNPGALEALGKRLAQRAGCESFSGSLVSGSTTFTVLPVDPEAAKKPRTAKNPGQYPLGGAATFVVTRRGVGERVVNEAHIAFSPSDATKPAPREPHRVKLPDDYDSWAAAWMRGGTVLWICDGERIHRYDVTDPAKVEQSVPEIEDVPAAIRDALTETLDSSLSFTPFDCQVVDALTGQPIEDARFSIVCAFVRPAARDGKSEVVDTWKLGPTAAGKFQFAIPEAVLKHSDHDSLRIDFAIEHPKYETFVSKQKIALRDVLRDEPKSARDTFRVVKMTPKKKSAATVQGVILSVGANRKSLELSVGSEDGVRVGTKFEVREQRFQPDRKAPVVKGVVEVVRVVDGNRSEARVVETRKNQEIAARDVVVLTESKGAGPKTLDSSTGPVPTRTSALLTAGREIELVGVADAAIVSAEGAKRSTERWWKADGSLLDVEPIKLAPLKAAAGRQKFYEFVLRTQVNPDFAKSGQPPLVPLILHGGLSSGTRSGLPLRTDTWHVDGFMQHQFLAGFDDDSRPGSISFYYSDRVAETAGVMDLSGKVRVNDEAKPAAKQLLETLQLDGIDRTANETIVRFKPNPLFRRALQLQALAIRSDGKTVHPEDSLNAERWVFKTSAAEVEALQLNVRPMSHRVDCEDLALQPGQACQPRIVVTPLDECFSVKFRQDGKTLGVLAEMRPQDLAAMLKLLQPDLNSASGELRIQSSKRSAYEFADRIVKQLVADGWMWPKLTLMPLASDASDASTSPPQGLEFLKPYPQLHGLSLEMSEKQFHLIAAEYGLRPKRSSAEGNGANLVVRYEINTGDGHVVIVMFDGTSGKCRGIQRVRGDLGP